MKIVWLVLLAVFSAPELGSAQSFAVESPVARASGGRWFIWDSMPAELARIEQILAQPMPSGLAEPVTIEQLESRLRAMGIPAAVDRRSLEELRIRASQSVDMPSAHLSLGAWLTAALDPLELTWTLDGEVLFITSEEGQELRSMTIVYDVRSISSADDGDELIDFVTSTIDPDGWLATGEGVAEIRHYTAGGRSLLSVFAPYAMQRDVRRLLNDVARKSSGPAGNRWPMRSTASLGGSGSTVVAIPPPPTKRGIALPGSGVPGGFGGGGFGGGSPF